MLRQKVTICNKLGLHARASSKLVNCAGHYGSSIKMKLHEQEVNAKSIMGVMVLGASKGTEIELIVDGEDELEAMTTLVELIEHKFDEGE
tara:strand:+ start:36248 stop:36517 length:270 start_codon:yes stop_codon:yes gene_type:complete